MPKPKFDFTISLGHIGQMLVMLVTVTALYFRMDTQQQLNKRDIELHTKQIDRLTSIQESQSKTLAILTARKSAPIPNNNN